MKKIIIISFGLLVLYFGSLQIRAYMFKASAIKYATNALGAIASPWSTERILERATPSLKSQPSDKFNRSVALKNAHIGTYRKTNEALCKVSELNESIGGRNIYAACTLNSEFSKTSASVDLLLYYTGSKLYPTQKSWMLEDLRVKPQNQTID